MAFTPSRERVNIDDPNSLTWSITLLEWEACPVEFSLCIMYYVFLFLPFSCELGRQI